jgi:hypothetical protein
MSNLLISPLVAQQLPEFVRGEYSTFITFIEKYYEWMEQSGNVVKASEEVQYAQNVDLATDYYIEQIKQEFLPYFPESIALDKRKFLKLVNNFYSSKGTPNSLKFLFRALYNEEIEIYYPKDDILKASDGKWVLPLALRIDTNDNNIFNIEKNLITGLTSKATALVEKVTRSVDRQLGVTYVELYISNVDKIFSTGEIISSTYNNGTTDITVTGRLIGALSEIQIDPNNRGLFYNPYDVTTGYPGDPVSIVGGLNPIANTPIGAIAYVGETTQGGIPDIIVSNGGFGFRDPLSFANTSIIDFTGGFSTTSLGTEARAQISLLDENTFRTINVSNTMISTLLSVPISNVENNAISSISTFQSFNVFPIAFVSVTGQGGGYRNRPEVDVYSFYMEDNNDELVISSTTVTSGRNFITSSSVDFTTFFQPGDQARFFVVNRYEEVLEVISVTSTQLTFSKTFENDITGVAVYKLNRGDLRKLGSLGRITVVGGGTGYANGDTLSFNGGSGYGANAFVSVNATGTIISATMNNHSSNAFVIGGEGYSMSDLPTITINTSTGANAILQVTEIVGDGEQLDLSPSRVGSISKLRISSFGYDYTSSPTISLRNADVTLSNVTPGQIFVSNTVVYQGSSNTNTTFTARVDKFNTATNLLRIFDYRGVLNTASKIISDDGTTEADITSIQYYGDGRALATASFENGLIRLPGLYLNTDGQVSSDKRLQDGEKYHNFSYVINTQNDYYKFKNALNGIVHPVGTKTFVNRIDNNQETIYKEISSNNLIQLTVLCSETYNVANGSNNMVCTNVSANLVNIFDVGDIVILNQVSRPISGTANVTSGSNTITGVSSNFINDIIEGDIIYLSTGNTETVSNVISSTSLQTQNTINVTETGVTINLVFNDTKMVNFVNANTILVNTNFTTNSNFVTVSVQKVK